MTEISPIQVKNLREKTGAGMMDCKKALVESKGDFETAVDWLRKKGLSAAAKKSGRTAAEGLVAIASESRKGVVIELNSETDFVARNDKFQALAKLIATQSLKISGDIEVIKNSKLESGKTLQETITENIATIGENINFRRTASLSVNNGIVATYVHNAVAPNLGKIGVLVAIESSGDQTKLEEFGKKLAMHIAAQRPDSMTIQDLSQEKLEREKGLIAEQAKAFYKKFSDFSSRMEPHKPKFKGERSFSEKQLEAKLDELSQMSENFSSLEGDEDKKAQKLLETFFGEAAYLLKKVGNWGDELGIIKKLSEIKLAKYYEDSVLMEQIFVIDNKTKISDLISQAPQKIGAEIKVTNYARFQLGEGIEKETSDFAAEVAAAVNS